MSPTVKTGLLLSSLTALFIVIGYLISGVYGALVFLILSLVLNFISYWFSDKIALTMAGAQLLPLDDSTQRIYAIVDNLSKGIGIPMPKIYITADMQPNAFATGRGPSHSAICFTQGILQTLTLGELEGVIAHELGHIKNRDVLISTIAAVIAGSISSIANIGILFGSSENEERNPLVSLLLLILAPVAATVIQLAISRAREFEADATAARVTKKPQELANALIKIDNLANQIPFVQANPALSTLFIQNPFRAQGILELFSTHPTTQSRVERLSKLKI